MTHPLDLLSAYLDDELSFDDRSEVTGHLDGCPECASELEDISSIRSMLRALPVLEPPAWVGTVVPIEAARSRRTLRFARWASAAAAAVVLLAGVVVVPDEPAAVIDLDTMSSQHVARVVVDPGISTIRGPVAGP